MFVDLHLHTTCSDGKLSVKDTIKTAHENKIEVLAITDHDSVLGLTNAIHISKSYGITCISGVEISCRNENSNISFPDDISVHMLGYNIDYNDRNLNSYLSEYHQKRHKILMELINELVNNKFDIKYDEIYVIAGTQMRIQDIVNHINASFISKEKKQYLIEIANSYYNKLFAIDCTLKNAIMLIKNAGGVPVLAHAFFSYKDYDVVKNSQNDVYELIDYLDKLGIGGIEVFYSRFTQEQSNWLLSESCKRNLLATVGSDFHGTSMRKDMMNYHISEISSSIKVLLEHNRYKVI